MLNDVRNDKKKCQHSLKMEIKCPHGEEAASGRAIQ